MTLDPSASRLHATRWGSSFTQKTTPHSEQTPRFPLGAVVHGVQDVTNATRVFPLHVDIANIRNAVVGSFSAGATVTAEADPVKCGGKKILPRWRC